MLDARVFVLEKRTKLIFKVTINLIFSSFFDVLRLHLQFWLMVFEWSYICAVEQELSRTYTIRRA